MPKLFAGLDVADRTTVVCILTARGRTIFEGSSSTSPEALAEVLAPYKSDLVAVGLETGIKTAWLHKGLLRHGYFAICLDARRTHAALAARRNKSDKGDAHGLALVLCRGMFSTSHVKSKESQRIRTLLVHRKALQRKAHDVHMALRMTLKSFGGTVEIRGRRRSVKLSSRDSKLSKLIRCMLRAHHALSAEFEVLDRLAKKQASADVVCRRLMTIPGVGPLTSLTFKAAIDNPLRFSNSRDVAAYFGLTPRRFQSGEKDILGRITRRGDRSVRNALYEAASVLMIVSRSEAKLRRWALALKARKGFKVAAVACARKLAVVMHRMWVTGRDFDPDAHIA